MSIFKKKTGLLILLAVLVAAAALVLYLTRQGQQLNIPPSIGELQLKKQLTGEEAAKIINQMHGKGVTATNTTIGMYASTRGNGTLYLSEYETAGDAGQIMQRMVDGIKGGNSPFTNFDRRTISGLDIAFCMGDGQSHYFFADRKRLYWLSADPMIATTAMRDLVQILKGT